MLDTNSEVFGTAATPNSKYTWFGLKYSNSKWIDWIGRTSNIKSEIGGVEVLFGIQHDFDGGHTDNDCLVYRANNDIANEVCSGSLPRDHYACTKSTKSWSQRSEHDAKLLKILGNPGNICDSQKSTCNDNEGSYTCPCEPGYEHAENSDIVCINIDECTTTDDDKKHNCDGEAKCTDTEGSFTCGCNTGYSGSGINGDCKDIDECNDSSFDPYFSGGGLCQEATQKCKNNVGSYECESKTGFEWKDEAAVWSSNECIDIDECSPKSIANHELCDANSLCVNTVASYKCSCNLGYYWDEASEKCKDYDECDRTRREWTMEGAICPTVQIGSYNEIKDKCSEHQMVPLTVQTESQRDAYTDSSCANSVKDSTLHGHYWGFHKDGLRQWTDVHENAVYKEELEKFIEINDNSQKCVTSWHAYIHRPTIRGGDYTCSNNNIGYVCIKPWADALANPDPFEFSGNQRISFDDFTAVETKCREKGLYPMSLTNNMDISKLLHMYKTQYGIEISQDYSNFFLLKQETGVWKDWVGRTSDIENKLYERHGIHHGIGNIPVAACLVAWQHHTYDTDDQGCINKYFACAKNTQPYSRRSEYNAQVLEWLENPGNNCNLNIAACSNSEGSYTCECKTGTFFTFSFSFRWLKI